MNGYLDAFKMLVFHLEMATQQLVGHMYLCSIMGGIVAIKTTGQQDHAEHFSEDGWPVLFVFNFLKECEEGVL